jgi:hypothetical protein
LAEVVKHFYPHLVEIHNYSAAHSVSQKTYNWNTLNQKVFKKIGFMLTKKDIEDAVNCVPDTVEKILKVVQTHVLPNQVLKFIDQIVLGEEVRKAASVWAVTAANSYRWSIESICLQQRE